MLIRLYCRQRVGPELKKTVCCRAVASSYLESRSVANRNEEWQGWLLSPAWKRHGDTAKNGSKPDTKKTPMPE